MEIDFEVVTKKGEAERVKEVEIKKKEVGSEKMDSEN